MVRVANVDCTKPRIVTLLALITRASSRITNPNKDLKYLQTEFTSDIWLD